jgi:hypothetical protein
MKLLLSSGEDMLPTVIRYCIVLYNLWGMYCPSLESITASIGTTQCYVLFKFYYRTLPCV